MIVCLLFNIIIMEFDWDCDVLSILCENMPYIIKKSYTKYKDEQGEKFEDDLFLEEWFKIFSYDIDINFDSSLFFILPYTAVPNIIHFEINNIMPIVLRQMILYLIEKKLMKENIKNQNYRIHFRVFEDRMTLDDPKNQLRKAAFVEMHRYIKDQERIRIFLVKKLIEVRNKLMLLTDDEEDEVVKMQQIKRSVELVIQSIEEHTTLAC